MRFQHIALYLPNDGEIDPSVFIKSLWRTKKQVTLPVLHPVKKNQLWFLPYTPHTHLHKNRFGIPEPSIKNAKKVSPRESCNRRFPVLCGLAHEFQKTESLPAQSWDIPLEAIVTEANIYWVQRNGKKQEKPIYRSV